MRFKVPAPVKREASKQELGEPLKHHTRVSHNMPSILSGIVLLLLSLGLIPIAVNAYPNWKAMGFDLLISVFVALVAWVYFYPVLKEIPLSAYEYTNGFIEFNKKRQKIVSVLRWDRVQSVDTERSRYGKRYIIVGVNVHEDVIRCSVPYRRIWKRSQKALNT